MSRLKEVQSIVDAIKSNPVQLSSLPDDEQEELLNHLEQVHISEQRKNIKLFARAIEVPGAPTPDEAKTSDIAKRSRDQNWTIPDEILKEEFYGNKLSPAAHHDLILTSVQRLIDDVLKTPEGEPVDGLMITAPPGSAKSSYASMIVPAFVMGYRKKTNIIAASFSQELSDSFSRRVRSIVDSPDYKAIFPEAGLTVAGVRYWAMANGSEYRSTGVGAGIAGFRCNLLIMDDLIANREDAQSDVIREKTWSAISDDLLPRAKQDLFKILAINTRFHEDDHFGRFLGEHYRGQSGHWRGTDGRNWYILNLPLHAEHDDDPLGREVGERLWPEWYKQRFCEMLRNDKSPQGTRRYASLYQQRPAPSEGSILARSYWREWKKKDVPECSAIYLAYDTAFEEGEENDFSAMTAWGVFEHVSRKTGGEEYNHNHVILLGAWKERVSSIDLIDTVQFHAKIFKPDRILVEKRASGIQLIQEMTRRRLPVKAWLPKGKPGTKGKVPRAHAIAAILEGGSVWYIPGPKTEMVIDSCAAFPFGKHDDDVDTVTCALAYFRDKHIFMTADDELDEDELKEALLARSDASRKPRRLYAGPVGRSVTDLDDGDVERMTPETRRRVWGG